ncbi:MAG: DUF4249 family protein [Bacteroidota bacterium]
MKHLIVILVSFFLFNACSNELELTAPWKNIPVIYGVLNEADRVQYIRVEKAFLDESTNALDLAKNVDSVYYSDISVQLERPSLNTTLTLERVDGVQEGLIREDGVFATDPNFLYKLDLEGVAPLQGGEKVRLLVSDSKDQLLASSETTIVESFDLVRGRPGDELNFSNYDRTIRLSWRPQESATIYDVQFVINYRENVDGSSTEFVDKSVTWTVASNLLKESVSTGTQATVEVNGEEFYAFLDGALESSNKIRQFVDLDFIVTAGGSELSEYIRIRQANTGLTSSQNTPIFSNIEGGLGLFSSTATTRKNEITLTPASLDSLVNGFYTRDLNFR